MIDRNDAAAPRGVRPSALAFPLALRSGVTLKNRLAKSAMSEGLATTGGHASPALERLYARLGQGGAGLLITGNVMVSPEGVGEPGNVVLGPDTRLEPLAAWARAATSRGAPAFAQLNHAGRQAPRRLVARPVAPSAVPLEKFGLFGPPRALEDDEIEELVRAFGRAAALMKRAGFDGVQLHAAHGYLFSQFLSPRTNLRTDRWGGSLDGRMRFLLEAYRAARAATGPGFAVAVKLNSADFLRGGFSSEDAAIVARSLSEEGVDLLEVSGGTYERPEMAVPRRASTAAREAHFLGFAREVRGVAACPIMLTGGVRTPALMESIVAEGAVDVVGLARPIAIEPDLPREVLAGRVEPSRAPPAGGRVQLLAAAFDNAWHQAQLRRMGDGQEPDAALGRWTALGEAFLRFVRSRPRDPQPLASASSIAFVS